MAHPDLSVIVTNYNTGPYLVRCLESLRAQELDGRELELIVVENASFQDQQPWLRQAEGMGARVLRQDRNHGHGGGCNRGLAAASGRIVFLVNSDTVACPGALACLARCLEGRPDAAFVEPQTFLDDDCAFLIPETLTPSPLEHSLAALGQMSGTIASKLAARHARRSVRTWRADAPIPMPHLTGAFLGARRDVVERLGGYDEGYPLYYEDSDLFARARELGLELLLAPQARVVHYLYRSVALIWEEAMAKAKVGRARYLRLHHGPIGPLWDAGLARLVRWSRTLHSATPRPEPIDLGRLDRPAAFDLAGRRDPWLLQMALQPLHLPSTGRFCSGERVLLSQRTWDSLYPTTYWVRALDLETFAPLRAWRFTKGAATAI